MVITIATLTHARMHTHTRMHTCTHADGRTDGRMDGRTYTTILMVTASFINKTFKCTLINRDECFSLCLGHYGVWTPYVTDAKPTVLNVLKVNSKVISTVCFQYFDAVCWVAGRASGL